MPTSIIIPAHNEEFVIGRCLSCLLEDAAPGELEVIVVCNDCSDQTARIAASYGRDVRVIESSIASKTHALNLGDSAATHFPRFYIDADVLIQAVAVRRVGEVLLAGEFLAAAPSLRVDLTGCSWPIRAFYSVWLDLPYIRHGMIGSGVYALSRAGRARFSEFPPVTSDDGYVRLLFSPGERATVDESHFTICPPKTLRALIRIKTRAYTGAQELLRTYPELRGNDGESHRAALARLGRVPSRWPELVVYLTVRVSAILWSRIRSRFGRNVRWERDETSRQLQQRDAS